jgi:hypothetical protein
MKKFIIGSLFAVTVASTVAACGGGTTSSPASTVTITQTQPASSAPAWATSAPSVSTIVKPSNTYAAPAPATDAAITIPDLIGQNAKKIAQNKLMALGLTNIELASATPKYQNVFVPANWTVVGIEPAPGTAVNAGDTVVVKVTKP